MYNRRLEIAKQLLACIYVCRQMLIGRYREYSATECFDLILRNHRGVILYDEIKLDTATVDMTIMIHDGGFHAAAHHSADNLCYTNEFRHNGT